ncbi:DNA (cytosine-5-)-methyltransferase [Streptomyces albidoflavus]|uniref:DNA (cytosine-5-)-methyltransferase n=1 Tax=Streptomyces albidoflavus TaxID=1886 RepID=UPI0033EB5C84
MRNSKGQYDALPGFVVNVLPTPTARDWRSGASNLHGKNSRPLNEVVLLFKTPTANLGTNGAPQHPDKRKAGGHGPTLDDEVSFLLPDPDPTELTQDWAEYEPAIRRQEAVTGRTAPLPTELGPRGGRRLTARFAEWLMGLPDGWVTAVPGLNRSRQLHKIGNGVAPLQAFEAYSRLLALDEPQQEDLSTLF